LNSTQNTKKFAEKSEIGTSVNGLITNNRSQFYKFDAESKKSITPGGEHKDS